MTQQNSEIPLYLYPPEDLSTLVRAATSIIRRKLSGKDAPVVNEPSQIKGDFAETDSEGSMAQFLALGSTYYIKRIREQPDQHALLLHYALTTEGTRQRAKMLFLLFNSEIHQFSPLKVEIDSAEQFKVIIFNRCVQFTEADNTPLQTVMVTQAAIKDGDREVNPGVFFKAYKGPTLEDYGFLYDAMNRALYRFNFHSKRYELAGTS